MEALVPSTRFRIDADLKKMSWSELQKEVMKLRRGIRKHRDATENARCWHNDLALYGLLPEERPPGRMLGSEQRLLVNCRRYIRRQRCAVDCQVKPKRS